MVHKYDDAVFFLPQKTFFFKNTLDGRYTVFSIAAIECVFDIHPLSACSIPDIQESYERRKTRLKVLVVKALFLLAAEQNQDKHMF